MHLLPLLKGLIIGFVIAVPTGPVGFLCAKRAITHHYKQSIASSLGSITADMVFGLIVIFGMTTISDFFKYEQHTIRFLGGLLLIYVGIKTFFDIPPAIFPGLERFEHLGNFASTFSLTITNPIQIITLPIVFTAIGSNVTPGNYGQALIFMIGLIIGSCVLWVSLISFLVSIKKYIRQNHFDLINKVSGSLIVGTGLYVFLNLLLK